MVCRKYILQKIADFTTTRLTGNIKTEFEIKIGDTRLINAGHIFQLEIDWIMRSTALEKLRDTNRLSSMSKGLEKSLNCFNLLTSQCKRQQDGAVI